jgi:exodeoxyribonuclease VII large subunit
VGEITAEIHRMLSHRFDDVRVSGEISGLKIWSSGHCYFSLKDESGLLRAIIWRNALRYMKAKPAEGLSVIARGSIEVRAERGEYQMIVSSLEAQGEGALMLAFERLKRKLAEEGLFAQERKRPLPAFPRRIGIVTSPQGAVIRDMISVLTRRWPGIHIRLYPTLVQGDGAAEGVCAGLRHFSESGWAEVVIVGRGGGSLEDLWTFNEEAVARAIFESTPPVISAVGHETDFTIADFVADLRAPTPSAAAELVVRDRAEVEDRVESASIRARRAILHTLNVLRRRLVERGTDRATRLLQSRIGRYQQTVDEAGYEMEAGLRQRLQERRRRLDELERRLRQQDPRLRLARSKERLLRGASRVEELLRARLAAQRQRLAPLQAGLEALSPVAVLARGYSIVADASGHVIKEAASVATGAEIGVRLHRGTLAARVTAATPEPAD